MEIDCLERKQKLSSPSSCNDAPLTPSSSYLDDANRGVHLRMTIEIF